MAKLTKAFRGVPDGEIYPRAFDEGDECPLELEAGAIACGALEPVITASTGADKKPAKGKSA